MTTKREILDAINELRETTELTATTADRIWETMLTRIDADAVREKIVELRTACRAKEPTSAPAPGR